MRPDNFFLFPVNTSQCYKNWRNQSPWV